VATRVRYLSSAGIHPREISGIGELAQAFPSKWLLYTSLQCYPAGDRPIELDAMVVMDDRVLLLEIKDFHGTLTANGDQWILNNRRRFRSPVDLVAMKARKVKTFLSAAIPGFSKYYVDSRVVLTGNASKQNLTPSEQQHVWTLQEAAAIGDVSRKSALLQRGQLHVKKIYELEAEIERVVRNAKMFGPLEAEWDGYRVVDEDFVVHPSRIWREHRAERISDNRYKALLRIWAFDKLPAGLNSPDKRQFIANREMRAIGRLNELGSSLVDQGVILPPIGDEKNEILTQHFELRGLLVSFTTLDRYLERASADLLLDDRITVTGTLLNVIAELHAQDIAHRDLGPRSIWAATPTRLALTGFMACQMPDEESLGDWTTILRGQGAALPEDIDKNLAGTAKQRDVYALGGLATQILKEGQPRGSNAAGPAGIPIPDVEAWIDRATARQAFTRFSDAREMADEFGKLVEQLKVGDVDQTLLDRHESNDVPYVLWPVQRFLKKTDRHVYVNGDGPENELVIKIWLGIRRGINAATDAAMTRLFDGVSRLVSSPIPGLPQYIRTGLSPTGPFVVYRYVHGTALKDAELPKDGETALRLSSRLIHCVNTLHAIGHSHGDICLKNGVLSADREAIFLLDLFDISEVGDGSMRTPGSCPENWERLTDQQLDRYGAVSIVQWLLENVQDSELAEEKAAIAQELARPALDTLDPVVILLRNAIQRIEGALPPRIAVSFQGVVAGRLAPDNDQYYLRAERIDSQTAAYRVAGIDRELALDVRGGEVIGARVYAAGFTSLTHASQHGVPIRLVIDFVSGPDAGLEELHALIAPLVSPELREAASEAAEPSRILDVSRYWRKLLEIEAAFQPEVEILQDIGPSSGPTAVYAYERTGQDFDFDAGSTVEVRLPNGRKVGEVNVEQTDAQRLVVDYSDRRLIPGDQVNLVDRRARTSFDRRNKAVERILDKESAIPELIEYFTPDQEMDATDCGDEVSEDTLDRYELNKGQKDAFRHVIRFGPVGLLQGPPGTGKTHFIASLAHWLVADKGARKILIASQSHEAVNNAIEALLDLYKRLGGRRPSLLRIGSKGITDKIRPYHTTALQERFQSRFENAFKHRVSGLGSAIGLKRDLVADAVDIDRQLGERIRRLRTLAEAEEGNSGLSDRERRQRATAMRTALNTFASAATRTLGREVDISRPEEELDAAFETLLVRHAETSLSDLRKARHLIELSRDWSASLSSRHRNFEEFLAKTRTIVTATCVGVGQTRIRMDTKTYDWVIVDEAARCTPSELAVPIQLGRRVLLVGDHRQLLPMTERAVLKGIREEMPETPAAEFNRSDFERAYLSRYGQANGHTLTEQYRMTTAICELVSRVFYEPHGVQLITSKDRKADPFFSKPLPKPLAMPITWIDTTPEPAHTESPASWDETTFWNEAEVTAVIRLLERISEQTELVAGLAADKSETPIGVICMYSAQRVKIDDAFSRRPWDARFRKLVRIETVDSYQGKENSIVIMSLVRCNRGRDQGHVRIPNRCNVALSRARERLFIVGALAMWDRVQEHFPMRQVLLDIASHPKDAVIIRSGDI
jgi:tRNA A-37 threonylcarbamoyl transferase component Bud32